MRARVWHRLACLLLASAVGCTGSDHAHVEGSPSGPVTCEASLKVPEGFEVTESFEDPYQDHIGIRIGFRDASDRELHYFAGIRGEFGEGLPLKAQVGLATGEQGSLLGADETWVLVWQTEGPCAAHAVLGSRFTRPEFLEMLQQSGVSVG
ncbi:MAG: hypothetical protein AB1551_06785 [Actinomycetota bacterium]